MRWLVPLLLIGQVAYASPHKGKRVAATFQGHNAAKSTLRKEPLTKPSGDVWVYAENLGEELKANIYKPDGTFDDAVLAKLDDMWRDTTGGEVRAVDAELYEMLSRICDHYGKRVSMVSGFRFHERDSSRHFNASAMDIRIPGVSDRDLYHFAETLDVGNEGGNHGAMGIGIYPTTGFVHIDFRAPGEPSFRWTDYSGHPTKKKSSTPHTQPARKPVS